MKQNIINRSMIKAALVAGKILKSAFNNNSTNEISKGNGYYDVVSKADTDSENAIIKIITTKLPTINILSEEKGFINHNSKDTIVVDPLDGSANFLLGLPHFSISLVHYYLGEIIASVVYNPILDKMYFAEKGKGAFLNNKKLKFQTKRDSSYITVNFSHKAKWKEKRKFFDQAYNSGFNRVLNNWSPNLDFCLLAEGKVDAVISSGSLIFDYAPGFLIAKEVGCIDYPKIKKINEIIDNSMSFVISNKTLSSKKLFSMI